MKQAARFKKSFQDVQAPSRVEQVIAKVRALSFDRGGDVDLAETVYRAMIAAFIDREMVEKATLEKSGAQ